VATLTVEPVEKYIIAITAKIFNKSINFSKDFLIKDQHLI